MVCLPAVIPVRHAVKNEPPPSDQSESIQNSVYLIDTYAYRKPVSLVVVIGEAG